MKKLTEIKRLMVCKTIEDVQDSLEVFAEILFSIIESHSKLHVTKEKLHEAKIILQMIFTKSLHLKNTLYGISYEQENIFLRNIIDPGIIAILIRNIYETIALFHLIFIHHKGDEQDLVYNMWCLSGLKYRRRFDDSFTITDAEDKLKEEIRQMNQIEEEIINSKLYESLDPKSQNIINESIKKKHYLIQIKDSKVNKLYWNNLIEIMNLKEDLFRDLYTYFSLYTHPSNVSVFQFQEMFKPNEEGYKTMTVFNMKVVLALLGVFVADYIKLFPSQLEVFKKLDPKKQAIIEFHNRIARGEAYSIDSEWESYMV